MHCKNAQYFWHHMQTWNMDVCLSFYHNSLFEAGVFLDYCRDNWFATLVGINRKFADTCLDQLRTSLDFDALNRNTPNLWTFSPTWSQPKSLIFKKRSTFQLVGVRPFPHKPCLGDQNPMHLLQLFWLWLPHNLLCSLYDISFFFKGWKKPFFPTCRWDRANKGHGAWNLNRSPHGLNAPCPE